MDGKVRASNEFPRDADGRAVPAAASSDEKVQSAFATLIIGHRSCMKLSLLGLIESFLQFDHRYPSPAIYVHHYLNVILLAFGRGRKLAWSEAPQRGNV